MRQRRSSRAMTRVCCPYLGALKIPISFCLAAKTTEQSYGILRRASRMETIQSSPIGPFRLSGILKIPTCSQQLRSMARSRSRPFKIPTQAVNRLRSRVKQQTERTSFRGRPISHRHRLSHYKKHPSGSKFRARCRSGLVVVLLLFALVMAENPKSISVLSRLTQALGMRQRHLRRRSAPET